MSIATISKTGRAAMALAISKRPLHMAWGAGNPEWDGMNADELPSLINAESLFAELGRRVISAVSFAVPDEDGDIVVSTGQNPDGTVKLSRYSQVTEPTPHLYMRVAYDYADAANAVIREVAIFMDTETDPELPPGQRYFSPGDITNPGLYLCGQIIHPSINRSPSVRQTIELVLPI